MSFGVGEKTVSVCGVELREPASSKGKGDFMVLTCKSIKGLSATVALLVMVWGTAASMSQIGMQLH